MRIEIPVIVSRIKNEVLGIEPDEISLEESRAMVYTNYICYILEQPDGTATVAMADGEELSTSLTYSDIKDLTNVANDNRIIDKKQPTK